MDPDSCRLSFLSINSADSTSIIFNILIIILLIILSAFLAASETAFSCCNKNRMKSRAEDGDKGAIRVCKLLKKIDKTIVATLIAINIAHVLTSTLATILFVNIMGENGTIVSTIVITILVFIFSETLPKNIAKVRADDLAIKYSGFINVLIIILYPLVELFSLPYKLIIKHKEEDEYDEEDLQTMVETIEEEGVLDEDESSLIQNAIEFDEVKVLEVYTPLEKVIAVDINRTTEEIMDIVMEDDQYSRLPVYDKEMTNIIGVLPVSLVLKEYFKNENIDIKKFLIEPYYVTKRMPIDDVLDGFMKNKTHMGFVKENDIVVGLITMDDVLDELVEDIVMEVGDDNE